MVLRVARSLLRGSSLKVWIGSGRTPHSGTRRKVTLHTVVVSHLDGAETILNRKAGTQPTGCPPPNVALPSPDQPYLALRQMDGTPFFQIASSRKRTCSAFIPTASKRKVATSPVRFVWRCNRLREVAHQVGSGQEL